MKTFIKLALVSNLALFAVTPAFAGQTIKSWMNEYYSPLNENTNCRYAIGGQYALKYCMKLKKAKQVKTKYGKRLYLLMTGDDTENSAPHASSGLVGMFVFAPDGNNKWKVISAKSKIKMGAWGQAPTDWTFHKFAPNKWGFLTSTGYTMGGNTEESAVILTSIGNSIMESVVPNGFDASGSSLCGNKCASISAKIKINRNKVVNGYYPLILTVNGKSDKGKRYKNRKYQATYKRGKGYTAPKNYPID